MPNMGDKGAQSGKPAAVPRETRATASKQPSGTQTPAKEPASEQLSRIEGLLNAGFAKSNLEFKEVHANLKKLEDSLPALIEQEVDKKVQPVAAEVEEVKGEVGKIKKQLSRFQQRLNIAEARMLPQLERTMCITVFRGKATSAKAAVDLVQAKLASKSFGPLEHAAAFPSKRAAGEVWAVVGELTNKSSVVAVIKAAADLKASGDICTLGWNQSKADRDAEALVKASAAFKEAEAAHIAAGGQKGFWLFGRCRLGREVWSLDRLEALGGEEAAAA